MAKSNYNDELKKYQLLLKSNQANLKAELGSIKEKSMATADAYRKQLGLEGSGVGQSYNAQVANNYSNALANLNAQNQQAEQTFKEDYTNKMTNAYQSMLENGASYSELKDFENQYLNNEALNVGTKSYLDALRTASGSTWENDRNYNLESIKEMVNQAGLNNAEKVGLSKIYQALANSKSEEEYLTLYNRYKDILQGTKSAEDVEALIELLGLKKKTKKQQNIIDDYLAKYKTI